MPGSGGPCLRRKLTGPSRQSRCTWPGRRHGGSAVAASAVPGEGQGQPAIATADAHIRGSAPIRVAERLTQAARPGAPKWSSAATGKCIAARRAPSAAAPGAQPSPARTERQWLRSAAGDQVKVGRHSAAGWRSARAMPAAPAARSPASSLCRHPWPAGTRDGPPARSKPSVRRRLRSHLRASAYSNGVAVAMSAATIPAFTAAAGMRRSVRAVPKVCRGDLVLAIPGGTPRQPWPLFLRRVPRAAPSRFR